MPEGTECQCLHDSTYHPEGGPCRLVDCACPALVTVWCPDCGGRPMGKCNPCGRCLCSHYQCNNYSPKHDCDPGIAAGLPGSVCSQQ